MDHSPSRFRSFLKHFLCIAFFFCIAQSLLCAQQIVVDDADLGRFNFAKSEILERLKTPSARSDPYWRDWTVYKELLKLDDKIVPFLIREMVQIENASVLYGRSHYLPHPISNQEWMERARAERKKSTDKMIPRHICLDALAETAAGGKAPHKARFDGKNIQPSIDEIYEWLDWWNENKDRYSLNFKSAEAFNVGKLDYAKRADISKRPNYGRVSCRLNNGLLDVWAAGETFQNIIEKAAAEARVKTAFCDDWRQKVGFWRSIEVNYRELSFDEFASAISHEVEYFLWRKQGDTYYFGSCSK